YSRPIIHRFARIPRIAACRQAIRRGRRGRGTVLPKGLNFPSGMARAPEGTREYAGSLGLLDGEYAVDGGLANDLPLTAWPQDGQRIDGGRFTKSEEEPPIIL